MEPIISPWILYWINVLGNLKDFAGVGVILVIIGGIGLGFLVTSFMDQVLEWDGDKIIKFAKKWAVGVGILLIITTLLDLFIPNQETLYSMFALNYITPDNIALGVDGIKSIIDYIFEAAATFVTSVNGG
jgi:hypothetical protein